MVGYLEEKLKFEKMAAKFGRQVTHLLPPKVEELKVDSESLYKKIGMQDETITPIKAKRTPAKTFNELDEFQSNDTGLASDTGTSNYSGAGNNLNKVELMKHNSVDNESRNP